METNTEPQTNFTEGSTIDERLQYLCDSFQSDQDNLLMIEELKSVLESSYYRPFIDSSYLEAIVSSLEEIKLNRGIVLSSKYKINTIDNLCQKCLRVAKTIRTLILNNIINVFNKNEDGEIVEVKEEY